MVALVIDTETCGLDPKKDRVIEIAVIEFESGKVLLKTYLDPGCPIPEEITKLTSITNEMIQGQPKFRDIAGNMHDMISSAEVMIGYNVFFDRDMLQAEFERVSLQPRWPMLICAKRLWDIYEPREERSLTNAYKHFVNCEGFEGAHGALADTKATLEVVHSQLEAFNLQGKPWEDLDPERKAWWGPTAHIIKQDGKLIVNFGKNKSKPVSEVDVSFWKWVKDKDFPEHITKLSVKLTELAGLRPEVFEERLQAWLKVYAFSIS